MLLHVMDFDDNILDSFGKHNKAVLSANHIRNKDDDSEILDVMILTKEAEHFKEFHRILIQDENKDYREFVITRAEKDNNGYSLIESSASYLYDIGKARSIRAGRHTKLTAKQALYETLRGIRWEVGTVEWAGEKTMSWTSERTPYEMLKQICTTYSLELDFTYTVDNKGISHRYVHLYKKKALFNGKEIKKGKDLLSLKRITDVTELNTALIALGPEDDIGNRLRIEVKDDKAQAQFGLSKRYIYGIYEPESDNQNMTEERLRTLAKTELKKRSKIDINYEVDALDIKRQFPHEVTRFGDIVRIKDRDFTPPLYAEAEVTGIEHDLVADVRKYKFGTPKEYKESDLRKYFTERLALIREQIKDNNTNTNTIIDTIKQDVERVEQKVVSGPEPPENPQEGQFWYDTTNPVVAILREYKNGKWEHGTAYDVAQIGGLRREQIIYKDLGETLNHILAEQSRLQTMYYQQYDSEYLVDEELKLNYQQAYNKMLYHYTTSVNLYEVLDEETATIGKLIDVQSELVNYRNAVQQFYLINQNVSMSINDRIKFLQAQYTDEKFSNAIQEVADKFGFQIVDGNLVGEPEIIVNKIEALRDDTKEQFKSVVSKQDYETDITGVVNRLNNSDSERVQLANEIDDRVTLTEYNNMKIGTENLLLNSKERADLIGSAKYRRIRYVLTKPLNVGATYTLIFDVEVLSGDNNNVVAFMGYNPEDTYTTLPINNANHNKISFVAQSPSTEFLIYSGDRNTDYNANTTINVTNAMLVEGDKIGDYQQASEDTDQRLTTMESSITQNGTEIAQRVKKEEFNASKQTLSRVLAEIVTNTTTGITLSYDENGGIQNFTLGPNGTLIDTKKLTIEAGDVSLKDGVFTVNKVNTKNVTIPRDDGGVPTIINGIDKQISTVTGMDPMFSSTFGVGNNIFITEIFRSGTWYGVFKRFANSSQQDFARVNAYYFQHTRRYLKFNYLVHVGTDADDKGNTPTGIYMRVQEFGRDVGNRMDYLNLVPTSQGGTSGIVEVNHVFDLGPPTGEPRAFYIHVKPNGEGIVGGSTGTDPRTWSKYSICKFAFRPFELYG
ncbi:phage tail spike protein [Mammaliicoccus sciuri]|uniref:phage tail spike protein n=1 Tax=Mammaliicoccus sciuri TaxID=1296 RepID=UPI003CC58F0E